MGAPRLLAPTTVSGGIPTAGAGTLNTVALWTPDGFTLGNSLLTQSGSLITNASGAIRANGTTQTSPAFSRYDSTTSGIYFPGTNEIGFTISNQHAMFISSGRFVGIGTASPGAQLHVERAGGVVANTEFLRLKNTTFVDQSNVTLGMYVANNTVATGAISHLYNATGATYDTTFSVWNGSALGEAMRIKGPSGNVGIGTAAPVSYANYRTFAMAGAATGAVIDMGPGTNLQTSGGLQIAATAIATNINAQGPASGAAASLRFSAGTWGAVPERMVISGSGTQAQSQVAIGTSSFTSYAALTTVLDLDVYGVRVGRGAGAVSTNTAVGTSALNANTSGNSNTAVGYNALAASSTAINNTAIGNQVMVSATGSSNTGVGSGAMYNQTTGTSNTALGHQAGWANTANSNNVSVGQNASLYQTGANNTAIGAQVMLGVLGSSTGSQNTAVGFQAGFAITTGANNVFIGNEAGKAETTGGQNTYIGVQAGLLQVGTAANTYIGFNTGVATTGSENTAIGRAAFAGAGAAALCVAVGNSAGRYISGSGNTSVGYFALAGASGATGGSNTAIGFNSLSATTSGANNTALGYQAGLAITTGTSNVFLGWGAGNTVTTGSQNICIGVGATTAAATDSNKLVIGSSGNYVATNGGATTYYATAGALQGYIIVQLNGTNVKLPVYAV